LFLTEEKTSGGVQASSGSETSQQLKESTALSSSMDNKVHTPMQNILLDVRQGRNYKIQIFNYIYRLNNTSNKMAHAIKVYSPNFAQIFHWDIELIYFISKK